MPLIKLTTRIKAPIERCYDLSRSIDLHKASTQASKEEAIAGITKGLIGQGDFVTWRARHLGLTHEMTTVIPIANRPTFFISRMKQGPFRKIEHNHIFKTEGDETVMIDEFCFEAPFGIFGRLAELIVLRYYMKKLLIERNELIKRVAESEEWRSYLN